MNEWSMRINEQSQIGLVSARSGTIQAPGDEWLVLVHNRLRSERKPTYYS
jgi:hypothetical protein